MQTLDEIRKQIKNIQGLKSIVRTMKVLASVSIRQYEKAAVHFQNITARPSWVCR
jgi:F-type H+-transporting ATPase subunit gamma